jgi:hypothetical protein
MMTKEGRMTEYLMARSRTTIVLVAGDGDGLVSKLVGVLARLNEYE